MWNVECVPSSLADENLHRGYPTDGYPMETNIRPLHAGLYLSGPLWWPIMYDEDGIIWCKHESNYSIFIFGSRMFHHFSLSATAVWWWWMCPMPSSGVKGRDYFLPSSIVKESIALSFRNYMEWNFKKCMRIIAVVDNIYTRNGIINSKPLGTGKAWQPRRIFLGL